MTTLQAVRPEGGIVPPSLFQHLSAPPAEGDATWRASLAPAAYHLPPQTTLRDAASRSWTYLVGAWQAWRSAQEREPGGSEGTAAALVRERWLLVLLQELGYGRLPANSGGITVGEQIYPVSHLWQDVPIHLLGPGVELDRRNPGVIGAARAPQAMVQELLNRSDDHLWAILSNGLRLRLLRDSTALAGSAYIEFDLEAIFDGELFADFLLLWQICHESRFEPRTSGSGEPTLAESWLEVWRAESVRSGARALDRLRGGVERALEHLGSGFIAHPANTELRTALATGSMKADDVHRHLLRLVYRLLFLFVTEDRDLLLDRNAPELATRRYRDFLSTARLRRHARERAGSTTYGDLWQGQRLVLHALGDDGEASLGLPALGGLFDTDDGTEPLLAAELTNHAILEAIRDLAWIRQSGERLQPVDYRNLGAEELGSVYEALLELVPRVDVAAGSFTYQRLNGNERKTTGSYYTPPALVSALLDTALDPVIDGAVAGVSDAAEAERRLLDLKVCDPACGSGHFLVAAARRIAQRLATVRSGENEPTPGDVRHALRDVIGRCVYGVDLNPLAAELAKVSLWLEAMEPGKALGFLDARIRVGNSLLGTTPTLLGGGVPDGAFKPLEGDEKDVAREAAKRNKAERGAGSGIWRGQDQLDLTLDTPGWSQLAAARMGLLQQQDEANGVRAQARRWREYEASDDYRGQKVPADAWVSAFVWPYTRVTQVDGTWVTTPQAPTSAVVRRLESEPDAAALSATRAQVDRLATQFDYFHWHIEFPEVFSRESKATNGLGWTGGFDAMLGNPPWEHIEFKEQEFFASRDPEIAQASGSKRKRLIAALETRDPATWTAYQSAKRKVDGTRKTVSETGLYPLTGRGRVKTDPAFTELSVALVAETGRSGLIVRTQIATDDATKEFFSTVALDGKIRSLFDFINLDRSFESIDSRTKYCLLTLSAVASREAAQYAFFLTSPTDIAGALFELSSTEITLLNPNTKTLPAFRRRSDANLTISIHRAMPILHDVSDQGDNPWELRIRRLLNMGLEAISENALLRGSGDEGRVTPVWAGKMVDQYDFRASTTHQSQTALVRQTQSLPSSTLDLDDPEYLPHPAFEFPADMADARMPPEWSEDWVLAWCDVTSATNARSLQSAILPRWTADFTLRIGFPLVDSNRAHAASLLLNVFNSFLVDFAFRQKVGGLHASDYIVRQLPVPTPERFAATPGWCRLVSLGDWLAPRTLELIYTSYHLWPYAVSLFPNSDSQPFRYDVGRRMTIRAEIDAAMFHLYGIERDDVDYIMETFPIVKRKDIAAHGEFRTKRLILEIYDAMQHAIDTGTEYQTILDPPPGEGPRHPPKE